MALWVYAFGMYVMTAGNIGATMSLSKVDREFYSLINVIRHPGVTPYDHYWEAIDELKHVWRSYYESD